MLKQSKEIWYNISKKSLLASLGKISALTRRYFMDTVSDSTESPQMEQTLTEAQRTEIEKHKYCLSQERGYDVGLDVATDDWLQNHAEKWCQHRQQQMLAMQREEIRKHLWIESEKAHKDLGRTAKLDWIQKYAAKWRRWYDREYNSN